MELTTILLAVGLVGLVMAAMAIGTVTKGRCLRGSCGGPEVLDADGESLRCGACPNPPDGRGQTTLPPVTSTTEPVT